MSESIAQSYQECDDRTGQSVCSFQSVWIARWTGTGRNATPQAHHSPKPVESKKSYDGIRLHDPAVAASNPNVSAEGLREFGNLTRDVVNGSLSSKDGQETHGLHGLLALKPHNDVNLTSGMANVAAKESCLHSMLPLAPAAAAISSGKHYPEPETSLRNPVKTHSFFRQSDAVASTPCLDHCRESASHIVPYRFDYGKFKEDTSQNVMPLLMDRPSKSQLPNGSLRMVEGEHNHNNHLELGNSMDVPTSSNSHPRELRGDWFHKLQSGSRSAVFRNNCTPFVVTEPTKVLHHDICMPEELPHSVHDVKAMRIHTTLDSVVGLTGGYPGFSQTTHSLLIMKNTDVNICKQNITVGTSRTCNEFNDFDNLSPFTGQNQQGVKLQLLDSSTGSEREEDIRDAEPSEVGGKNESSAETDTMDIDVFPRKTQLLGFNASPLKKAPERDQNLPQLTIGSPAEQVGTEGIKNMLADINLQLPAIPAEATSVEHLEPSSKTQSLDMESLLAHAEQPINSKDDLFLFNLLGPEPSSRWVKRLKLSSHGALAAIGTRSSNSKEDSSNEKYGFHGKVTQKLSNHGALAIGTRSSNSKEDSSNEKYGFHGKITQGGITISEPTNNKHQGKELIAQDKCAGLTGNCESSSTDTTKTGKDLLTSHSWIHRLLRNRAISTQKKPEVVVCEPQSSKLVPEDLQKRKFPSIAAMALMGKAMKGFQPCEFQKRGSFVVWNTSGF